jgi:myo-inositol-1(or 4)-monophosphatase
VAGTPKVYGQLVQILTPYTRVLKEPEGDDAAAPGTTPDRSRTTAAAKADSPLGAFSAAAASTGTLDASTPAEPVKKTPTRIRKADLARDDDAPM